MNLSASQVAQLRTVIEASMATTVAVETYTGSGAFGPVYAASVNVTCDVDATRRLVRNADGQEVVSEFTLYAPSTSEATFTPESRVTIATRVSTVLAVNPRAFAGQVTHVEVNCS